MTFSDYWILEMCFLHRGIPHFQADQSLLLIETHPFAMKNTPFSHLIARSLLDSFQRFPTHICFSSKKANHQVV